MLVQLILNFREEGLETLQPQALNAFFGDLRSAVTKIQSVLDKIDPSVVQPDGKPYQNLLPAQLLTTNDDTDLPEETNAAVAPAKDEDTQKQVPPVIEETLGMNSENVASLMRVSTNDSSPMIKTLIYLQPLTNGRLQMS